MARLHLVLTMWTLQLISVFWALSSAASCLKIWETCKCSCFVVLLFGNGNARQQDVCADHDVDRNLFHGLPFEH